MQKRDSLDQIIPVQIVPRFKIRQQIWTCKLTLTPLCNKITAGSGCGKGPLCNEYLRNCCQDVNLAKPERHDYYVTYA